MRIRIILEEIQEMLSQDDPLNEDNIGEKELLVVSFGTSFNTSRAVDIGGVEKALGKRIRTGL